MTTTSQKAYAQAVGTTSTGGLWIDTRGPSVYDVNYQIGQQWLNKSTQTLYYLANLSNASGQLQATWNIISVESELVSLSDTANTVVHPSGTIATPPDNIQLINVDGSMTIVSDPSNHRIVFGLTGAGIAIEQITGATGTPITPSGTPENVNILGSNGITTSGDGAQTLTVTGINATNTGTIGVTTLATDANTINPGNSTSQAVTPSGLNAKLGAQTSNGVAYGGGTTSAVNWTANPGANVALLGNSGAPFWDKVPNATLQNSSITVNGSAGILINGGATASVSLGGSVTVSNGGTTFTWNSIGNGAPVTLVTQNGYLCRQTGGTNTCNYVLDSSGIPSSIYSFGDTVKIISGSLSGGAAIDWNLSFAGYPYSAQVDLNGVFSTNGIQGLNPGDCVELICTASTATAIAWVVASYSGTPTLI